MNNLIDATSTSRRRAMLLAATLAAGLPSVGRARGADRDLVHVRPMPPGGDFRLDSASGVKSLADLRGQAVALFFGFMTCPDVCPTTLGTLQQAFSLLNREERSHLRVLFVSVDPERDTPQALASYVGAFPVPALGLTGKPERLDAVANLYGAQYRKVALPGSALGYTIEHSAAVYLIDPHGRLRLLLRHTAPPQRFAEEFRRLLRAGNA